MTTPNDAPATSGGSDFIRDIVREDLRSGKHTRILTRFPPEPNGYPHIGHAKSICLNFSVAEEFGGVCNLRFDDTNPETENMEYVEAIQRDIRWLGFDWQDRLFFASDYFEDLYRQAVHLIETGKAYVDSLDEDGIREYRGTISEPGRPSPYRDRSVAENLDLFARMRAGEFEDGAHVLRAKIDLAAKNMLMRDPVLYRIRKKSHYRTGDAWCIYPLYDFTHCLSDAFESITHSLCTLEFENNRELYDWVIDHATVASRPRQYEFARLNLSYTVTSKRKLLQLVHKGLVSGWDDPRMPTLSGLRRRGVPPRAIRDFCDRIGVAKTHNVIDVAQLEFATRDVLNQEAPRVLAVLRPLKIVIENHPPSAADAPEWLDADYFPHDVPKTGSRRLPFSREIYIERDDFEEEPPPGYFRLAPGREVRLRYAYIIRCVGVVRDDAGKVVELRCTSDPDSRGGQAADGRKVQGTIHWVSAAHSLPAEVRLYDRLFVDEAPDGREEDFETFLNPKSLEVLSACRVEPGLGDAAPGDRFQFERRGYFVVDEDSSAQGLVFNRTVTLRDTWAKVTDSGDAAERRGLAAAKAKSKAAAKARQRQASRTEVEESRLTAEQESACQRYRAHGAAGHDAQVLAQHPDLGVFYTQLLETRADPRTAASWVVNEVGRELKDRGLAALAFGAAELAELLALIDDGTITGTIAKQVFAEMAASGGSPGDVVRAQNLEQLSDESKLAGIVETVLRDHPDQVAAYRAGKTALIGFFVGQVMKASRGRAHPQRVHRLLGRRLADGGTDE
ncbi:MAG: glutamine--tRNA ligase/YqeY domain fusion protein [Thermoanaerobaculia bacterium]